MKQVPKLLLIGMAALVLMACASVPSSKPMSGVIVSFTEDSVTLRGANADVKLKVDAKTIVTRADQVSAWLDVARKGLFVDLEESGGVAKKISVPFYGLETQGEPVATSVANMFGIKDVRVNRTDSSLAVPSERKNDDGLLVAQVEILDAGTQKDSAWSLKDSKTLMLGSIVIVPNSVSLKISGKALKIIDSADGKGQFDKTVGTSALLDSTKGVYTLMLDTEIGKDYAEASKVVDLTFTKKVVDQKTTEITYLKIVSVPCVELNGKLTSLSDALAYGNFWLVRCNTGSEIIHVDAYMVMKPVTIKSITAKTLVADINGKAVTLNISEGATLAKANGSVAAVADFKAGAAAFVTTEPADGYNVVFLGLK